MAKWGDDQKCHSSRYDNEWWNSSRQGRSTQDNKEFKRVLHWCDYSMEARATFAFCFLVRTGGTEEAFLYKKASGKHGEREWMAWNSAGSILASVQSCMGISQFSNMLQNHAFWILIACYVLGLCWAVCMLLLKKNGPYLTNSAKCGSKSIWKSP